LQLIRRLRLPALFCAFAVLVCELLAHPSTTMSVCDDGPYILMARTLATTGHIAYNGWAAPMLGWQLYLGAAFIKLFGFSFTAVRMGTICIAMLMAFVLQRTLVAASISGRNATLATLAFVLSPLYLMLSATFMTDIYGLFAIVLCLYACLRALHTSRSTLAWLLFAILSNALCGTSRQIGWLGILLLVPSTLFLLRHRRTVFLTGIIANLAGFAFICLSLHWLKLQPYSIPEHLLPDTVPLAETLRQLYHTFLDAPFLLLPIIALFLPEIRRSRPRARALISALSLGYILLAVHYRHLSPNFMLMPTHGDWVGIYGIFEGHHLQGLPPIFLGTVVQVLLTIASIGGLLGLLALFLRPPSAPSPSPDSPDLSASISWKQLGILLSPFSIAYILLLIPRAAATRLFDRYLLALLVVALLCLTRYYQDRIHPRLPFAGDVLVAIMAIFAVTVTHNTFALYRARVALAGELHAAGVPDTAVDNGWEYNLSVELQHAPSINFPTIAIPAHAYVPAPPPPPGPCQTFWYDYTPHIHPIYGISFDPTACDGPAPFAPVHFSRWPYRTPGALYVVNYIAPTKP
jgi:Dolichyl-phosphate-mannose-protein mannosyltransferase